MGTEKNPNKVMGHQVLLALTVLVTTIGLGFWFSSSGHNLDSLRGKRVIVTGASGGIGEYVAYEYAKHGANVVVTARRQKELERVSGECRRLGLSNSSHKAVAADMKDVESIRNLVKQAVDHMGGLDIVVLNHITEIPIASFTGNQESVERLFKSMNINFRSYVEMTALVMSQLIKNDGALVVVNSIMGHVTSPKVAAYSASKQALNGFFNSLRSQFILEKRNVAVTSCILGLIDTAQAVGVLKASGSTALNFVTPAPVDGAAEAIVAGSAGREDVVYYPYYMTRGQIQIVQKFFPFVNDWLQRLAFTSE